VARSGGARGSKLSIIGIPSSLESFCLSQDEGRGLLIQGTREWANYAVSVDLKAQMAKAAGLAARVQGLRRYYALLLRRDATAALVKVLDGERELAHVPFDWQGGKTYRLRLSPLMAPMSEHSSMIGCCSTLRTPIRP